jgi:hypothetical protein
VAEARVTVETAIELLMALNHVEISKFARQLRERLDALLAPLTWLEQPALDVVQARDPGAVPPALGSSQRSADPLGLATSASVGIGAGGRLPKRLAACPGGQARANRASVLDGFISLPPLVELG